MFRFVEDVAMAVRMLQSGSAGGKSVGVRKQPDASPRIGADHVAAGLDGILAASVLSEEGMNDMKKRLGARIKINVSGLKFETKDGVFLQHPDTLMGDVARRQEYYNEEKDEFFFDRHRPSFEAIFRYYQTGNLVRPTNIPVDIFADELRFFDLGDDLILDFLDSEGYPVDRPLMDLLPETEPKRTIWLLFDYPDSSVWAKIVGFISISVILISIAQFCIETLPQYKSQQALSFPPNATATEVLETSGFFQVETACVVWFCFELLIRFYASPSKVEFVKDVMNIMDLISIVPYFVTLGILIGDIDISGNQVTVAFVRVLKVVRVFRIFKLSRHFTGMQILGKTLHASMSELGMLLFFLSVMTVFYASGVYYAEFGHPKTYYTSIPEGFWWAVVTMTTVGYGDQYPVSLPGKIVGSMCVVTGLLVIALPVPIIVENFNHFYGKEKRKRELKEKDKKAKPTLAVRVAVLLFRIINKCGCQRFLPSLPDQDGADKNGVDPDAPDIQVHAFQDPEVEDDPIANAIDNVRTHQPEIPTMTMLGRFAVPVAKSTENINYIHRSSDNINRVVRR
ncbi:potassium voltage-gated channel subfamily A member 1-like isoform X2 [Branchiostoma floridae x Branchiostoma japonicum]